MKAGSKIFLTAVSVLTCLFGGVSSLQAQQDYWRVVNAEQFKRMSNFERAQYGKALKMLNDRQYRPAANEFERFLVQYQSSDMKPYIIFLRGYALLEAKDRNKAIDVFNEVLDFFPGVVDAAAPALYYRGVAHLANGDYSKGMKSMKELVDNEEYMEHPVGAAASLQLVRNHWRNKEPQKAEQNLRQIFETFHKTSPKAAEDARNYLVASYLATERLKEYQSWYMEAYAEEAAEKKIKGPQFRINMVNLAFGIAGNWQWVNNDLLQNYRGTKKYTGSVGNMAWKLLNDNRPSYEKADAMWDFYTQAVNAIIWGWTPKNVSLEKMVSEACQFVAKVPDDEKNKGRQQNRYTWLTQRLLDANQYDQALYVNAKITNKLTAAWNEYTVKYRRNKWQECLDHLDKMESNFKSDTGTVKRIGWERGNLLRDRLGKYDDAIKVYRALGDPPRSLWAIVECHKRKKDVKSVVAQLTEIENAFQNDAPQAAWARADYYNNIGDGKMAIKEGRYIMKRYPKSTQSSWAHQLLEKYGVDSGGGVEDDM